MNEWQADLLADRFADIYERPSRATWKHEVQPLDYDIASAVLDLMVRRYVDQPLATFHDLYRAEAARRGVVDERARRAANCTACNGTGWRLIDERTSTRGPCPCPPEDQRDPNAPERDAPPIWLTERRRARPDEVGE